MVEVPVCLGVGVPAAFVVRLGRGVCAAAEEWAPGEIFWAEATMAVLTALSKRLLAEVNIFD